MSIFDALMENEIQGDSVKAGENVLPRRVNANALEILQRGKSVPLAPRERDRVRGKETSNPPDQETDASASPFENDHAVSCFQAPFPLTPTLSLGERENEPPRWMKADALEMLQRDKSAPLDCEELP